MKLVIILLVFWVLPLLVAESLGGRKGRNGLVYGAFLSWIGVGLLALLPESAAAGRVACPACRELIKPGALVCPFCRSDLGKEAV